MEQVALSPSLHDLYETDFYAWTKVQAAALRRISNDPVGIVMQAERLATEILEQAHERRDLVHRLLCEIMAWRLMVDSTCYPAYRPAWLQEIERHRGLLAAQITASLAAETGLGLEVLFARATALARRRLLARSDGLAMARLPLRCPWTVGELVKP